MDRTSANRTRISLHFFFFCFFTRFSSTHRPPIAKSNGGLHRTRFVFSLPCMCVSVCVFPLFTIFHHSFFLLIFILPSMCVLCIFVRSFFSPFFNLLFKYCVHFFFCLITFLSSGSFKLEMVCSSFYYFSFFLNNVRTFDRSTRTLDDKK